MRAVISVLGKDQVGILAGASAVCMESNANIEEVTQAVLQKEFFAMTMIIEISQMNCEIIELQERLQKRLPTQKIHVMHEDIFNAMHRI